MNATAVEQYHAERPDIEPNNLIAQVAQRSVETAIRANPNETVLFSIEGLPPDVTCMIAKVIAESVPNSLVRVHPSFSGHGLCDHLISMETPAYWRNRAREAAHPSVIVFGADGANIDTAGETIAAIRKIDLRTLLGNVELWLKASRFPIYGDGGRSDEYLRNALTGLCATDLVLDLPMFAQFVLRLAKEIDMEGKNVNRSLDAALPVLRLPRDAGKFRSIPQRGRMTGALQWAKDFMAIEKSTRDKLYLRNGRGAPLDRKSMTGDADKLLAEGQIDQDVYAAVRAFLDDRNIEAGNWTAAQQALVEYSWKEVGKIFTQRRKPRSSALGNETLEFFNNERPGTLETEDEELLSGLDGDPGTAGDQERQFFFDHRESLRGDKRLYKHWERFVFRQAGDQTDLLSGILTGLKNLIGYADEDYLPENPHLYVHLQGSEKLSFWTGDKNTGLCRYLKYRYRGLPQTLAPFVALDFGICWSDETDWENEIEDENESAGREATEFKINLYLLDAMNLDNGKAKAEALRQAPSAQFIWRLPGSSIVRGFAGDLKSLVPKEHGKPWLLTGEFTRNQKADKGQDQRVRLDDQTSILDAYEDSEGELLNPDNGDLACSRIFVKNLYEYRDNRLINGNVFNEVKQSFDAFQSAYTQAIKALHEKDGKGIADPVLIEQADRYGHLLKTLRQEGLAFPKAFKELWSPMLRVGLATDRGSPCAILTPLHPLRLAEVAVKARQAGALIKNLLSEYRDATDHLDTLLDDQATCLASSYYPTVAISNGEGDRILLVETGQLGDYSLLEPPTPVGKEDRLDETSSGDAVTEFLYIADQYLEIQPHERANFSCVLYNSESRDLPRLLTEKLGRKIESEPDLRCDLILTHDQSSRLRMVYAQQNAVIGGEMDAVLTSEATRSFLSRLRVGFNGIHDFNGRSAPSDIVFLQDVLSRHADLIWKKVEVSEFPDIRTHQPPKWSKQSPFDPREQASAVYLTPPCLPEPCQTYVDLIHDYLTGHRGVDLNAHHLPLKRIAYSQSKVKGILDQAHSMGDWVVNYDSIVDRRLLESNGIRIIRYLTNPGSDHKLIVSSRAPSQSIKTILRDQLLLIDPTLTDGQVGCNHGALHSACRRDIWPDTPASGAKRKERFRTAGTGAYAQLH